VGETSDTLSIKFPLVFLIGLNNGMKANPDKCHLLLSTKNEQFVNISNFNIKNSKSEKLLGVTIDSELKFVEHINNMCVEASQKLSALSRIIHFMSLDKQKTLMSAFVSSTVSILQTYIDES